MANNAFARYLMYNFPLSTVAVTKSFTNVINIGNAVRWQSAHVAVEILGCSIFEGSKLHESNGWDLEGVRGRAGTGKLEGGICAWTRKDLQSYGIFKSSRPFRYTGKMCYEYNLQARVSDNFRRVSSSQEPKTPG